ncbi:hypothetical protein BD770DRAFT_395311 [Pilaira anomala]|nr:hypothetical protein BD770DRAFT_395311 [Pilaira anomala]
MNPTTLKKPSGLPTCDCSSEVAHELGASPCRSADHWYFALSNIRQTLYTNTACTVPSPALHLVAYERKLRKANNKKVTMINDKTGLLAPEFYKKFGCGFNEDLLSSRDIFEYRVSRSEHILLRIQHAFIPYKSSHSFVRLSPGVFLIQKFGHHDTPVISPALATISSAIDFFVQQGDGMAPIDTFSFNDLFNDMMQQSTTEKGALGTHVPYTYTLGIRYTQVYKNMKDIVVYGNIPLWCQTLFITECMRMLPIEQGTSRKGLLPFAKEIEFHFVRLGIGKVKPDLLIMYERFAAEISDPHMMFNIPTNETSIWEQRQADMIAGVLFCNINEETAAVITKLADAWALEQGISVT